MDGSPIKSTFISPLNFVLSGSNLGLPENNKHAIAFLISSFPKIYGAIECVIF